MLISLIYFPENAEPVEEPEIKPEQQAQNTGESPNNLPGESWWDKKRKKWTQFCAGGEVRKFPKIPLKYIGRFFKRAWLGKF